MITYTEHRGITTKTEYAETDMIGWSVLDATPVYRATITEFSISKGVIARYAKVVNALGGDYKPPYYRNIYNGFTPTHMSYYIS